MEKLHILGGGLHRFKSIILLIMFSITVDRRKMNVRVSPEATRMAHSHSRNLVCLLPVSLS